MVNFHFFSTSLTSFALLQPPPRTTGPVVGRSLWSRRHREVVEKPHIKFKLHAKRRRFPFGLLTISLFCQLAGNHTTTAVIKSMTIDRRNEMITQMSIAEVLCDQSAER